MINTRPDLTEMIEQAKPEQKTELSEALWSHAANHGTPLVTKDHNGFQALFLYRSNKANLSVRLKSADLHDRLTKDSKDGQTELFQHISGTDIYYLKVSGLPANACAEYSIQVGDSQNSTTVTDRYNKHPASNQKLDLSSNIPVFITDSVTYMKMPEAVIPASSHIKDKYKIKLSRETFHSDRYKQFQDRNVFTYQSDDFQPQSGKVIFMLDGEDFCKSILPGIAAASKDPANPLSNTAIVFVDSKTDSSHPPIPDRVREFYFDKSEFSKMLAEEIIPHYSSKLGVTDHERCILAGHSLAGYPVMDVAANHSDTIGGVILISPAFNQKQEVLPDHADKNDTLKSLPIYSQIGQLEDTTPSVSDQNNKNMKSQSRLESNVQFHLQLKDRGYNVAKTLNVHPYGHANSHALTGLEEGIKFISDNRPELNNIRLRRIGPNL